MGIMVKYSDFYGQPAPVNAITLLSPIPKEELIATFAAINTRLNPLMTSHLDDSVDTQVECIRVAFLDNNNPLQHSTCLHVIRRYLHFPRGHNIFTRATCLYAFQEVLAHENFAPETPAYTFDIRERIFKYLLIVNERILLQNENFNDDDQEALGENFFEYFAFKMLPFNQYNNTSNSINAWYKSKTLFDKIKDDDLFGSHLMHYLKQAFDIDDMEEFFKRQIFTYYRSLDKKLQMLYINIRLDEIEQIKILDKFSERQNTPLPADNDMAIFDFLELKKSPLYRNQPEDGRELITYIVMDSDLFLEKTYALFVNDFWFDYLRPNNICNRTDWGNFIGSVFFETFIEEIFQHSFQGHNRIVYKSTDELKFQLPGQQEIEYADFYLRDGKNVIVSEAKSNYLPMVNGYKTVRTIADYQALNMERFYKDYGLTQLALKTVKLFHSYKTYINDNQIALAKPVKIFPLLIVNDPILSSGAISFMFRRKFEQVLKSNNIELITLEYFIMPMAIVHISELQQMEQALADRKENIFNLLRYYHSITNPARIASEGTYIVLRTFEQVLGKHLKHNIIANRIRKMKNWIQE